MAAAIGGVLAPSGRASGTNAIMDALFAAEKAKGSKLTVREIWEVGDRMMRKYNLPRNFAPYRGPWD
jgi:hypothetical protein